MDPLQGLLPAAKGAFKSIWLLWVALGVTVSLHVAGVGFLKAHVAGSLCVVIWVLQNVDVSLITWEMLISFADIFFREISTRGTIPDRGPVILAIAPHANQFLDPIIVVSTAARIDIGFIAAAATLRRPLVGMLARAINSIPVERAQDIAQPISGTCSNLGANVTGISTQFTTQVFENGILCMKGLGTQHVQEVVDDQHLKLKLDPGINLEGVVAKAAPKISQGTFFRSAINHLESGKVLGIFPEGGSHDQTHFLDMKPGVAILALQSVAKSHLRVSVVPVGLNYFRGHRFRSRVFVNYGEAITITPDEIERFNDENSETRGSAISDVLAKIRDGLHNVTIEAPNYEMLQLFAALRRLYTPDLAEDRLQTFEKQALVRAFSEGYDDYKDHPDVILCLKEVSKYSRQLKECGLTDGMVRRKLTLVHKPLIVFLLVRRLIQLLMWGIIWMPAGLLALPHNIIVSFFANRKAKEAVAASSVKIKGYDVLATWKVLICVGLWPTLHIAYTFLTHRYFGEVHAVVFFFFMPFFAYWQIKFEENFVSVMKSVKPLVIMLIHPRTAHELVFTRQVCVRMTKHVVEDVGWGKGMSFGSSRPSSPRMERSNSALSI